MKFQIGIVKEYNGYYGTIITSSETYKFLNKDIGENEIIEVNDYVIFRGERINDDYRAYFVKFFSKNAKDFSDKTMFEKFVVKGN